MRQSAASCVFDELTQGRNARALTDQARVGPIDIMRGCVFFPEDIEAAFLSVREIARRRVGRAQTEPGVDAGQGVGDHEVPVALDVDVVPGTSLCGGGG
jgi:hypothetical protein